MKTQYNTDKSGLQKKIDGTDKKMSDTCELIKKKGYSAKITEIEGKLPSFTGLATTAAFNDVGIRYRRMVI